MLRPMPNPSIAPDLYEAATASFVPHRQVRPFRPSVGSQMWRKATLLHARESHTLRAAVKNRAGGCEHGGGSRKSRTEGEAGRVQVSELPVASGPDRMGGRGLPTGQLWVKDPRPRSASPAATRVGPRACIRSIGGSHNPVAACVFWPPSAWEDRSAVTCERFEAPSSRGPGHGLLRDQGALPTRRVEGEDLHGERRLGPDAGDVRDFGEGLRRAG